MMYTFVSVGEGEVNQWFDVCLVVRDETVVNLL